MDRAKETQRAADLLLLPLLLAWLLVVLVAGFWKAVLAPPPGEPVIMPASALNVFLNLIQQDRAVGMALLGLTLALWLALRRGWGGPRLPEAPRHEGAAIALIALAVFLVAWAGRVFAHHGHDLVLDESIPTFQARIFLAGHLAAPIPPEWRAYAEALQPHFLVRDEALGVWLGQYRPGHALLRAAAMGVGAEAVLNPLLAAGSVLLVAHLARAILPDRPFAPLLAAALLATSTQVLATAASGFSFTAHLFFALLWLALFRRGDLRGHAGAALVGAFALGLHQVHVHAIYAAPFLLAHLLGRFGRSAASLGIYVLAYGIALPAWVLWPEIALALTKGEAAGLAQALLRPEYLTAVAPILADTDGNMNLTRVTQMPVNLVRLAAWLSPALVMLLPRAHLRWRRLPIEAQLGLVSAWLMLVAHIVLMPHQTHGWGYRYLHPILGCLVLAAVAAMPTEGALRDVARSAVAVLLAASVVLVPWRFAQVDEEVRPRALAARFIAGLDADLVLVQEGRVWFGGDLLRNDPLLRNRPLVLSLLVLEPEQVAALSSAYRVVVVGPETLHPFGIARGDWVEPIRPEWVRPAP